jgi:hypothetical protein
MKIVLLLLACLAASAHALQSNVSLKQFAEPKPQTREFLEDYIIETLGLTQVWSKIEELGFDSQIYKIIDYLIFSTPQNWEDVKLIFNQMVQDLAAPTTNSAAPQIIAAAVNHAQSIFQELEETQKRDNFEEYILTVLGLKQVWDQIIELGAHLDVLNVVDRVLFATPQKWESVKQLFNQMAKDLQGQVGSAKHVIALALGQAEAILAGKSAAVKGRCDFARFRC